MKLRIISDLHLDVNQDEYALADKNIFTIVAGDTAGDFELSKTWLQENIRRGIIIEGNHMLYSHDTPVELFDLYAQYEQAFPVSAQAAFLQNSYKMVDDIVFIGATLWTDYQMYGAPDCAKVEARCFMNDFRWGKTYEGERLHPDHYEVEFQKSMMFIRETLERFPNKKCVVVTHHAPSEKSIAEYYKGRRTNESFASDLDDFILSHPNIVLWCHGHVHSKFDYTIGSTRIYCNPRGYIPYGEGQDYCDDEIIEV